MTKEGTVILRGRVNGVILAMSFAVAWVCLSGCGGGDSKKESGAVEKIVPGVTKENVKKIKEGMSEKEVAEILGPWSREVSPLSGNKSEIWSKDGHEVTVYFDKADKVTGEPIHNFGE